MTELKQFNRWNVDLAKTISLLGDDAFFKSLFAALRNQVDLIYPQVWLYHRDLPPQIIDHDIPLEARPMQIESYLDGPYQEDPFYRISMDCPRSHIYRLERVTAGKLEESEYFKGYYNHTNTVDEVIFLTRLADGSVINLSIMRDAKQGPFTQAEYDTLYTLAEPIAAAIQAHCHRDEFVVDNLLQPGLDYQIDMAFRCFGAEFVSDREREVLELMLRGYGTDTTAERLNISVETVRRHRKSIYKKLDVSSQSDLFSLFINTMPYIGTARGGDPLRVYMH